MNMNTNPAVEKFMRSLNKAIKESKLRKQEHLHEGMVAVKEFLPEYPVMALLEAEARELNAMFIKYLKEAFDVKDV
jgi:hypothetical protein